MTFPEEIIKLLKSKQSFIDIKFIKKPAKFQKAIYQQKQHVNKFIFWPKMISPVHLRAVNVISCCLQTLLVTSIVCKWTILLNTLMDPRCHGVNKSPYHVLWKDLPLLLSNLRKLCQCCLLINSFVHCSLELWPQLLNWIHMQRTSRPWQNSDPNNSGSMGSDLVLLEHKVVSNALNIWMHMRHSNVIQVPLCIEIANDSHKWCVFIIAHPRPKHDWATAKWSLPLHTVVTELLTSSSPNIENLQQPVLKIISFSNVALILLAWTKAEKLSLDDWP